MVDWLFSWIEFAHGQPWAAGGRWGEGFKRGSNVVQIIVEPTECSHFNIFTGLNARELSKSQGGLWGGPGPVSSGMLTWGIMGVGVLLVSLTWPFLILHLDDRLEIAYVFYDGFSI